MDDGPYLPYFFTIFIWKISQVRKVSMFASGWFEDKIQARDIFVKDCTFDGVMKPEINKVTGVENIHFENVTVMDRILKEYKVMNRFVFFIRFSFDGIDDGYSSGSEK